MGVNGGATIAETEEARFVDALCATYPSPLARCSLFLPAGYANHRLDALVQAASKGRVTPVGIEVTKGFQGVRVGGSPPSQNEWEAWGRLRELLHRTISGARDASTPPVRVYVLLSEHIQGIRGVLARPATKKDRAPNDLIQSLAAALANPLLAAFRHSRQTGRAEAAEIPEELRDIVAHADVYVRRRLDLPLVFDAAHQYVYRGGDQIQETEPSLSGDAPIEVELKMSVRLGPNQVVDVLLPPWVGIDYVGIVDAVKGKLGGVDDYRRVARDTGASELWLLVVADGSSQMTMLASPWVVDQARKGVKALALEVLGQGHPFFDRVILLAAAYWADEKNPLARVPMSFKSVDLYPDG